MVQAKTIIKGVNLIKATLLFILLSAAVPMIIGCGQSDADEPKAAADIIVIDAMKLFGGIEREPVSFPHDLHTSVLNAQGQDCLTCHRKRPDGFLSSKFMRLADNDQEIVMNIYHDNCIDCHNKTAEAGLKAGPTICGECHAEKPAFISTRTPFGFDKSLHQRHVKSVKDCQECHHTLKFNNEQHDATDNPFDLACIDCHLHDDLETFEMIYRYSRAGSCRDCHRSETEKTRSALEQAVHRQCIGCHLETDFSGPVDCAGCHDADRQQAIEAVEKPPRLDAGQPDFVLLAAAENERVESKLATVPFSHVGHEGFNSTCRVCHHEGTNACNECHTLAGGENGGGVKLQQAMHDMNSSHSCIGCHEQKKYEPECAGCHMQMEQGRLSEHACTICHSGPAPERLNSVKKRYHSLDQFRPKRSDIRLSFSDRDIPDTVTIGVLADQYQPAIFPHRKIVDVLRKNIKDSKVATYFHGHEDLVCQGCHHHSPVGARPPLCESCHGEPFNKADLLRPGLYGAYHRQCIGCHQSMNIEKPSDCVGCHAERKAES